MKTSAKNFAHICLEGVVSARKQLISILFILILNLFNYSSMYAQDYMSGRAFLDFGLDYAGSNNGHAPFYAPTLVINNHFNGLAISPLIYQDNNKVNGLKLSYIRNLSGRQGEDMLDNVVTVQDSIDYVAFKKYKREHKDLLEINFYGYVQYNRSLPLSSSAIIFEQQNNLEMNANWSQIKMRTAEGGMGFQLQFNITNSLSFKVYSGLGAYYHIDYKQELHRGQSALCLNSGATILYTFEVLHPVNKKYNRSKSVYKL